MKKLIFLMITTAALVSVVTAAWASPAFVRSSEQLFSHPHDLEVNPSGRWLFVADANHDDVKVLDAKTLALVSVIGRDELRSPHDVHFDSDGRLLVADSGNDRIVIYTLNGLVAKKVAELNKNMDSPEGVTSSPDGVIYVASTGNHKILKFYRGQLAQSVGRKGDGKLEFDRPHDIEFGPDGLLYIGDPGNQRIQVLTNSLRYHSKIENLKAPFREPKYLALDNSNQLYIADQQNNQLRILNADRVPIAVVSTAGKQSLNHIEGVEVIANKIWVSDTYNNRIILFHWQP